MEKEQNGEVWLVRSRPGGLEIPIAPREIADLYVKTGWEKTLLREEELSESLRRDLRWYLDDLKRAKRRAEGGSEN